MNSDTCQACGSNKIINNASILIINDDNFKNDVIIQVKTSNRLIFNTFERKPLKAKVCGSCGNVDLSVSNPQQLWEAYTKNKSE